MMPPLWLIAVEERDREALGLLSTGSAAAGYDIYREYAERLHNNLSVAGYTELAPWVAIGIWGLIGAVAGIKQSGELHRVFRKSNRVVK